MAILCGGSVSSAPAASEVAPPTYTLGCVAFPLLPLFIPWIFAVVGDLLHSQLCVVICDLE